MIRIHIGLAAALLCAGCQLSGYGPDEGEWADTPARVAQRTSRATPKSRKPPVPLPANRTTARVLGQLHRVGRELSPKIAGCELLPAEVSSFVSSIASQAKLLSVRIGAGATSDSLDVLAGTLRGGLQAVSKRTPSRPELRRVAAELNAAVRDLVETLQLLADRLPGKDMLAIEQARARLRNAAGNFETSVRTLVSECAAG